MSEEQTISKDSVRHKMASDTYSSFVRQALSSVSCNAAVFVNKGFSGTLKQRHALTRRISTVSLRSSHRDQANAVRADRSHHIFLPYFGGADGRAALRLALQLAENPQVTATIVHYPSSGAEEQTVRAGKEDGPQVRIVESDADFFAVIQRSLSPELESRVVLESAAAAAAPVEVAVAKAQVEVGQNPRNGGDLIIVARSFGRREVEGSCLGPVADTILGANLRASVLVVQGRRGGVE